MSLISQIFNTFVKPHSVNTNALFHFSTTMKEADALLLSGSNSMFVNFPIEDIYTIDKHACISLIQNIDHAMAHGINFQFLNDGDGHCGKGGINDYPAALELENRVKAYVNENNGEVDKTAIGLIILWSDLFVFYIGVSKKTTACGSLLQQSVQIQMSFQHIQTTPTVWP